jgi:hypothetical protein
MKKGFMLVQAVPQDSSTGATTRLYFLNKDGNKVANIEFAHQFKNESSGEIDAKISKEFYPDEYPFRVRGFKKTKIGWEIFA